MIRVLLITLLLSGCTASFQPYPSMSKADIQAALNQLQQNDQMLAQKIAEMMPTPKAEVKKK